MGKFSILSSICFTLFISLGSCAKQPPRCADRFDVPFNSSAVDFYSAAFQCPIPKGALELSIEVRRRYIVKKLKDGCQYCFPCELDEVYLRFEKWQIPHIEIRPGFDITKGNLREQYAKFGGSCEKMRRFLKLRRRYLRPYGRTKQGFKNRLCELLELARKVRDWRCGPETKYESFFFPVNPTHPIATAVTYMESVGFTYGL